MWTTLRSTLPQNGIARPNARNLMVAGTTVGQLLRSCQLRTSPTIPAFNPCGTLASDTRLISAPRSASRSRPGTRPGTGLLLESPLNHYPTLTCSPPGLSNQRNRPAWRTRFSQQQTERASNRRRRDTAPITRSSSTTSRLPLSWTHKTIRRSSSFGVPRGDRLRFQDRLGPLT